MGSHNLIENNTITKGYRGISTTQTNNTINNNILTNINGDYGIIVSEYSTVTNNIIKDSTSSGVYLSSYSTLKNNNIELTGYEDGIIIHGNNIKILDNNITTLKSNGILLSNPNTKFSNIEIKNNNISSIIGIKSSSKVQVPSNVNITSNIIKSSNHYTIGTYGENFIVENNQLEGSNTKGDNSIRLTGENNQINQNTGITKNTYILVNNLTTYNTNPEITVKVFDSDNKNVDSGSLNLDFNNEVLNVNLTNGKGTIKLQNLQIKEYLLKFNYISDTNVYIGSETLMTLKIIEKPSTPSTPDTPVTPTNLTNITNATNITNTTDNTNITNNTNLTDINTTIITLIDSNDLTMIQGNKEYFKGKLLDLENNTLIGQHVQLKLTRTSNGLSKIYEAVTDYNGEFSLEINLAKGVYTCEVNFTGLKTETKNYTSSSKTNTINILTELTNQTTILTTEEFIKPYGAGESFKGVLKDINSNVLIGHHVSVKLTRISSGASKTYDTVTDYTGEFKLQINLAPGDYLAECIYNGVNSYGTSISTNSITIF